MANRLQHETSPYLLQHAENPVDWYGWGPEALNRAKTENKPIFLSIGYSACHWCHVMEHESFEDEQIARQMNENFVCVKVDREERPDLDQIYMTAVQLISGRGGWPMSVFLTPDLHPFFGGTYWPPHSRMGMPGFDQVMDAVKDAWQNRRDQAISQAKQLTERIATVGQQLQEPLEVSHELLERAAAHLLRVFDGTFGGFGGAPKFPHAMDIQLLLRMWQRRPHEEWLHAATLTLDKMSAGGIYDHLGGGFARYSVDAQWQVPHFEKMLYDNALLANAYLESYLATRNEDHRRVVRETLDYVLRDMTDEAGGFHSAEDADSEGEEGTFYLWTPQQIRDVLGSELSDVFCDVYDVTENGNFEGRNILNLSRTLGQYAQSKNVPLDELNSKMQQARDRLLQARARRVRPGKDDKIIVAWNGLMIDSMARAARALDSSRYLNAAISAAEFIHDRLWQNGRLLHSWRRGRAELGAYLDDYTTLASALVSLYEASCDERWIRWACELMDDVINRFSDSKGGAFYYTANDHERLITRTKDFQDSAVPSGNAMAADALVRLAHAGQRDDYRQSAYRVIQSASSIMHQAPGAAIKMLLATDLFLGPFYEIAVVGDPADPRLRRSLQDLSRRYVPRSVLAVRNPRNTGGTIGPLDALFQDRHAQRDQPTAYICEDTHCWAPAVGETDLQAAWDRITGAP